MIHFLLSFKNYTETHWHACLIKDIIMYCLLRSSEQYCTFGC